MILSSFVDKNSFCVRILIHGRMGWQRKRIPVKKYPFQFTDPQTAKGHGKAEKQTVPCTMTNSS